MAFEYPSIKCLMFDAMDCVINKTEISSLFTKLLKDSSISLTDVSAHEKRGIKLKTQSSRWFQKMIQTCSKYIERGLSKRKPQIHPGHEPRLHPNTVEDVLSVTIKKLVVFFISQCPIPVNSMPVAVSSSTIMATS